MPKSMLIDAYHQEETRVAVTQGGKIEDFDFEYASRKPLRGNIYLARVTRVEPSLQAAFIEYGGNRHGFLAFGEIHPDYYQIPVADREVLRKAEALEVELAKKLAERDAGDDFDLDEDELNSAAENTEVAQEIAAADEGEDSDDPSEGSAADYDEGSAEQDDGEWHALDENLLETLGEGPDRRNDAASADEEEEEEEESDERPSEGEDDHHVAAARNESDTEIRRSDELDEKAEVPVEDISTETDEAVAFEEGGNDEEASPAEEEEGDRSVSDAEQAARQAEAELKKLREEYEAAKRERNRLLRAYKIQEVIKRRQIMLVQVVKEERGNKGAALTTYLSLAGRYGVLMPNTARGGGISRKITSQADRKRLKKAMNELDIPANMGLIVRTAGAKRSKVEIKRDYDYLTRLWERIRERTLESVAPCLIYEEASLIKRAIRDLYDKDTEQIIVQGEEGYREAKDFMKMLMPSHAKYVQQHKSATPLFIAHKVESQLDAMYEPVVQLKSGGYLVIQQTEALVSIDVNSGKATKERNVEATALKTNSEAAAEVARQCRLRDLAGLIVIDFIDMEENRNNRAVEKKLKEAMKNDRARTQIGSISGFGLLEMSRQRRRSGIVDGTTQACPVCAGAGAVRSHEMAALRILRAAEGIATDRRYGLITVKASTECALYILNTRRGWLERMEQSHGMKVNVIADSSKYGDQYEVSGSGTPAEQVSLRDTIGDDGPLSDLEAPELPQENQSKATSDDEDSGDDKPKRRRRRRRRKSGDERADDGTEETNAKDSASSDKEDGDGDDDTDSGNDAEASDDGDDENGDGKSKRKRRRGRRGGRRNRRNKSEDGQSGENGDSDVGEGQSGDETPKEQPAAAAKDESTQAVKADEAADPSSSADSDADKQDAGSAEPDAASGQASEPAGEDKPQAQEAAPEHGQEPEAEDRKAPAMADLTESGPVDAAPQPDAEQEQPAAEPEAPPAVANSDDPSEPRRIGWWQRAFQKT